MTAPQLNSGFCAHCDSPQGEMICTACATEERGLDIRGWLERKRPWLMAVEIAVVERLADDLEAT